MPNYCFSDAIKMSDPSERQLLVRRAVASPASLSFTTAATISWSGIARLEVRADMKEATASSVTRSCPNTAPTYKSLVNIF